MKIKFLIGIIILVVLFIVFLDPYLIVNNFVNSIFNPVDKSCKIDSDCIIRYHKCSTCGAPCVKPEEKTWAANKNWKLFCPIPNLFTGYACPMCLSRDPDVSCQQGICKIK